MRNRIFLLGVVAVIAAGTACGGDDDDATAPDTTETSATSTTATGWDGRVEVDFDTGVVEAPGFNEMIDEQQPTWANSARGAAEMLVKPTEEGETDMRAEGDSTVVITVSRLPDDSVEAVRYELRFDRGDDGLFRFAEGSWTQRCQPGRGHDDQFLLDLCV